MPIEYNKDHSEINKVILSGNVILTLSFSGKRVRAVALFDSVLLTISEGTIGQVYLHDNSELKLGRNSSISEINLYDSSSVVFPDGYVLKAPVELSHEQTNDLLSEHRDVSEKKMKAKGIYEGFCEAESQLQSKGLKK